MRRISGDSSTEAEASNNSSDSAFSTTFTTQLQYMNIRQSPDAATHGHPYIQIAEQPTDKFRFRYKSEMHGTHGSLTGITTNKRHKTYPTVHLVNFSGEAIIRCTLYNENTNTSKKSLHSHSLVVRRDNEDCRDPHDVRVSPSNGYTAIYQGMGIIHTAKKFIVDELLEKMLDRQQFLQGRPTTEWEKARLRGQAEQEAKNMNLNQVCLCFEAFELVGSEYVQICEPVLSTPINNMKSALTGELKITRLSTSCSDAAGKTELFLFVEKVGKKNIRVRFFQTDKDDEVIWEDYGKFSPEADVHHQYAIALRTPEYMNKEIEDRVEVNIQLVRISDNCVSNPVPFFYKPSSNINTRKRARMSSTYNSAELPTVVHSISYDYPGTISKEFNTDAMLSSMIQSGNAKTEDLDQFLKFLDTNSDELKEICEVDGVLVADGVAQSSPSSFEKTVHMLHATIQQISKTRPKNYVASYLESFMQIAHRKHLNILHTALSDECSAQTAINIINIIHQYDLKHFFDLTNNDMQTPLHIACVFKRFECISLLLKYGANPNVLNQTGCTPLHLAVMDGSTECVRALVDPNNYTSKMVLLELDTKNNNGMTALHLAIRMTKLDIFHILVDADASLDILELSQGDSMLHMAVQENNEEMVRRLLCSPQVDVSIKNHSDYTALDLALSAEKPNPSIVNMIRDKNSKGSAVMANTTVVEAAGSRPTPITTANDEPLFDHTCLTELSAVFNVGNRWKQLARAIRCEGMVAKWEGERNPALEVLAYMGLNGYALHHVVNVFLQLEVREALICLDNLVARRTEDE